MEQPLPRAVALSAALKSQRQETASDEAVPPGPDDPVRRQSAAAADFATESLRLRGAAYTLVVLNLADLGQPEFFDRLRRKIAQAPSFYRSAPMLIELEGTRGGDVTDFEELSTRLRSFSLAPIGVRNGDDLQNVAAEAAGLAVFPSWRSADGGARNARAEPPPTPPKPAPALVVDRPVRSGTQISAGARDLVITAPVSAGAEILSDGSIHVYAPLRGRALAGVAGDRTARIFCRSLEAELVAIAGRYRLHDQLPAESKGKPAQIRMIGDRLIVEPLE
jgi:septum site-determining protein MinC